LDRPVIVGQGQVIIGAAVVVVTMAALFVNLPAVEVGHGVLGVAANGFRRSADLRQSLFAHVMVIFRLAPESGVDVGEGGSRQEADQAGKQNGSTHRTVSSCLVSGNESRGPGRDGAQARRRRQSHQTAAKPRTPRPRLLALGRPGLYTHQKLDLPSLS